MGSSQHSDPVPSVNTSRNLELTACQVALLALVAAMPATAGQLHQYFPERTYDELLVILDDLARRDLIFADEYGRCWCTGFGLTVLQAERVSVWLDQE